MTASRPAWMERLQAEVAATPTSAFQLLRPPSEGGSPSAVLVLFGPADGGGEDVVLTERAHTMRSQPGHVSFPGGRLDEDDDGPVAGALREAEEEIGLDPASVEVVEELPDLFLRPSQLVVTPVLAWWADPHPVGVVDHREVARVVRAPVAELVDPARRFVVGHPAGFTSPGFDVDGLFVWGFTAMILDRLLAMAGLEQPWDQQTRRPLPGRFLPRQGVGS